MQYFKTLFTPSLSIGASVDAFGRPRAQLILTLVSMLRLGVNGTYSFQASTVVQSESQR